MTNSYPGGIYPIDEDDEDSGLEARIERGNGGQIAIPYSNVSFVDGRLEARIERGNGGQIAIPYSNVSFVDGRAGPGGAFDAVNELLEEAALPIRLAHIEDGSDTHIIFLEEDREKPHVSAANLLREALEWVTDKPWDDPTLLHRRISEFLGKPVKYPEYIAKLKENESDD